MNALGREITAIIMSEGPLSVERYMQLCLQHPAHGYYTTRMPLGRSGDFVTAPEISQMFGELAGLWAAQVWLDRGAPSPVPLCEIGPGRGTMMADVLRATRNVPKFLDATAVHLVETSPVLRQAQRRTLAGMALTPVWHENIATLPDGPALILANEFFDALPVRHYIRSETGWHERQIGLGARGELVFGAAAEPIGLDTKAGGPGDFLDTKAGGPGDFLGSKAGGPGDFLGSKPGAPGDILETSHAAGAVMTALAGRITAQGGALLVWDYGHEISGFGETLQAVAGHSYANPLENPGEADLTAHVDFAALRRAAEAAGACVHGPVPQGRWLERLGIFARAQALKTKATAAQMNAIDHALARLTSENSSMATLFKVLSVVQKGSKIPPGFED